MEQLPVCSNLNFHKGYVYEFSIYALRHITIKHANSCIGKVHLTANITAYNYKIQSEHPILVKVRYILLQILFQGAVKAS